MRTFRPLPLLSNQPPSLFLPNAIHNSRVSLPGNLNVQALGRASCSCQRLLEACTEEYLWVSMWEGPLPGGFHTGGKAAHEALWLLANGTPEQVRPCCSHGRRRGVGKLFPGSNNIVLYGHLTSNCRVGGIRSECVHW